MPVTQISRIQVRRGRKENLPLLSAGELGWCQDTRQLFIGNGSFEQGAAAEGNTEILTEFTDLIQLQQTVTQQSLPATLVSTVATHTLAQRPSGVIRYRLSKTTAEPVPTVQSGVLQYAYSGANVVDLEDTRVGDTAIAVTFSATVDSGAVTITAQNAEGVAILLTFTQSEF